MGLPDLRNALPPMDMRKASAKVKARSGKIHQGSVNTSSVIQETRTYNAKHRKRLLELEPIREHEPKLPAKCHREDDGDIQKRCKICKR